MGLFKFVKERMRGFFTGREEEKPYDTLTDEHIRIYNEIIDLSIKLGKEKYIFPFSYDLDHLNRSLTIMKEQYVGQTLIEEFQCFKLKEATTKE